MISIFTDKKYLTKNSWWSSLCLLLEHLLVPSTRTLIESKLDELKNVFVNETKELFIKEMKDETKKLFAEDFQKIKTETNKETEKLKSTSVMLQKHVKNLKHSNKEHQKNAKNMNSTVDVYV